MILIEEIDKRIKLLKYLLALCLAIDIIFIFILNVLNMIYSNTISDNYKSMLITGIVIIVLNSILCGMILFFIFFNSNKKIRLIITSIM